MFWSEKAHQYSQIAEVEAEEVVAWTSPHIPKKGITPTASKRLRGRINVDDSWKSWSSLIGLVFLSTIALSGVGYFALLQLAPSLISSNSASSSVGESLVPVAPIEYVPSLPVIPAGPPPTFRPSISIERRTMPPSVGIAAVKTYEGARSFVEEEVEEGSEHNQSPPPPQQSQSRENQASTSEQPPLQRSSNPAVDAGEAEYVTMSDGQYSQLDEGSEAVASVEVEEEEEDGEEEVEEEKDVVTALDDGAQTYAGTGVDAPESSSTATTSVEIGTLPTNPSGIASDEALAAPTKKPTAEAGVHGTKAPKTAGAADDAEATR